MEVFTKIKLKKFAITILIAIIITAIVMIFNNYFYKNQLAKAKERDSLTAVGTIEATTVNASFKIPGKIAKLYAGEGDMVREGQELAVLENREIFAEIAQAKGAYKAALAQVDAAENTISATREQVEAKIAQLKAKVFQAEAGLKDAEQKYDRALRLHENGVIPDAQMDEATNNYEAAKSTLEEAQAALQEALSAWGKVKVAESNYQAALGQSEQARGALEKAKAYLDNTHLESPITGYITQKFLEEGEMVNAGTPVFEITDLEHTYVKVFISEKKIGRVRLNQKAEITVDAFPGKVFEGKVTWINNAGEFAVKKAVSEMDEHDIRSFEVKIDIPNHNLVLKTGMTARVRIIEEGPEE